MNALTLAHALQVGLTALGCGPVTGVELALTHPSEVEELSIRGWFGGEEAFAPEVVARAPELPSRAISGTVVVLLAEVRAGELLSLEVEGRAPELALSARTEVLVVKDEVVRSALELAHPSLPPPETEAGAAVAVPQPEPEPSVPVDPVVYPEPIDRCGDGALDPMELCDDQNQLAGDGCDACAIEAGFVCLSAPSVCKPEVEVAVVDGSMGSCPGDGTVAAPFCFLGDGISSNRPTIVVRRGSYGSEVVLEGDRTLLAEDGAVVQTNGAVWLNDGDITIIGLTIRSNGIGVDVDGAGTVVELRDVTIEAESVGVLVDPGGVAAIAGSSIRSNNDFAIAVDAGTATIEGNRIGPSTGAGIALVNGAGAEIARNWIRGNAGGGVFLDTGGVWIFANNFVVENGSPTSQLGGVLVFAFARGSIFVNNTISLNDTGFGAGGLHCGASMPAVNSIVWSNGGTGDATADCAPSHSLIGVDPGYLGPEDYHLGPFSPAIDAGDPAGVAPLGPAPAIDVDGDARPAGGRVDVGADEVS